MSIKLAQPFPAPELRTRILQTRGFLWEKYRCWASCDRGKESESNLLKTLAVSSILAPFALVDPVRPALSGGMDWWRMEWPFCRVWKIFFRGRNFQENPWISAERAIFAKFQAPKFENSEPEKMQFHTPSRSIPPLDSLLPVHPLHTIPPGKETCAFFCFRTWMWNPIHIQ